MTLQSGYFIQPFHEYHFIFIVKITKALQISAVLNSDSQ